MYDPNKSISDIEGVIAKIGEDMSGIYNGVRQNWWMLRQLLAVEAKPDRKPSLLFKSAKGEGLHADDEQTMLVFVLSEGAFYIWEPNKLIWRKITDNKQKFESDSNINLVVLKDNEDSYKRKFDKETVIKISTSNLDLGESYIYSFKLIVEVKSENITFDEKVIFEDNEKLIPGNTYIFDLTVYNGKVITKIKHKIPE